MKHKSINNLLNISILRIGGGKSQPSIRAILLVIICACVCACSKPTNDTRAVSLPPVTDEAEDAPQPLQVRKSLYHNPDSLLYYAELAYRHDDPQGLFITGSAAYLRAQDPFFPDSCTTVPLDEANIMLLRAADLGHAPAQQLIHCLQSSGAWREFNSEEK